jgi:hypothetical protein
VVLAGCKLVDQRTFEATPTAPAAAQLNRPDLPKAPILTINFAFADMDWRPSVHKAVRDAEAHQPGVAFAVVTPIPIAASREVQDRFTRQGREDAVAVADELQAAGVTPDRITLGLRSDAGSPPREVRIYTQ